MKIRNGFVSNSSSSSFVVLGKNKKKTLEFIPAELLAVKKKEWIPDQEFYELQLPIKTGQMEFGWEFKRYKTFADKLNYVVAQIKGLTEPDLIYVYEDMLKTVLRKHVKDNKYLSLKYDYNCFYYDSISEDQCYIDHQSAYYEYKPTRHYLFLSEENLESFLFNTGSYIQCGNDNSDPTRQWRQSAKLSEDCIKGYYETWEEEEEKEEENGD